jgi:hypothetical protein
MKKFIRNVRLRLLLLLLFLVCGNSWGATTYLNTACALNGNGTSGPCATTGGGAGAYNTGASIFWASIGAGNTLYIARGTTTNNWAGIIIDSAVTIDDYTGNASGTTDTCPIWTRSGSQTFIMSINANDVTVRDICVTGQASSALINTLQARTVIDNVYIYENSGTGVGVRFNDGSSDGTLEDSIIDGIWDDGIGIGASATGTFLIKNVTVKNVDRANSSGDNIQAYVGTAANLIIDGGTYIKEAGKAVKQVIIYDGSGTVTMRNAPKIFQYSPAPGVAFWGTAVVDIQSLFVYSVGRDCCAALFLTNTGTTTVKNAILIGGGYGIWSSHASGNTTVYNSTIIGAGISAVYATTGGTFTIRNSYMDAPQTLWQASSLATVVSDYNTYGRQAWGWDAVLYTTLAEWRTASSQDANSDVTSDPGFAGGTSPITAEGVRLKKDSPLLRQGACYLSTGCISYDYEGKRSRVPPDIGAFQRNAP